MIDHEIIREEKGGACVPQKPFLDPSVTLTN